jgi:hypothetical protein
MLDLDRFYLIPPYPHNKKRIVARNTPSQNTTPIKAGSLFNVSFFLQKDQKVTPYIYVIHNMLIAIKILTYLTSPLSSGNVFNISFALP